MARLRLPEPNGHGSLGEVNGPRERPYLGRAPSLRRSGRLLLLLALGGYGVDLLASQLGFGAEGFHLGREAAVGIDNVARRSEVEAALASEAGKLMCRILVATSL